MVATGRYVQNATGTATSAKGQFAFNTSDQTLWWDVDGTGQASGLLIGDLGGATGWAGSKIVVIA